MIMKRDTPKFFSSRLIGIYILLIALLAFSHIDYINDAELIKAKDIFQHTIDNFMDTINDSAYVNLSQNGGGIIGALFSFAFVNLFEGTDAFLHISDYNHERIKKMSDVVKLGDILKVKVTKVDDKGKVNVSRKALLPKPVKKEEAKSE